MEAARGPLWWLQVQSPPYLPPRAGLAQGPSLLARPAGALSGLNSDEETGDEPKPKGITEGEAY